MEQKPPEEDEEGDDEWEDNENEKEKVAEEISEQYEDKDDNEPTSQPVLSLVMISQETLQESELPVVSVIVNIHSGTSYDDLYDLVPQKAPQGRVHVYSMNPEFIPILHSTMQKGDIPSDLLPSTDDNTSNLDMLKQLTNEIKELEPECALFTWECCSAFDTKFPNKKATFEFLKFLIERKHFAMFSDFALKAMIKQWDQELGPNPFRILSGCNNRITYSFNPETLKKCVSPQLQMVGSLNEKGNCSINAMSGTIVFGARHENLVNSFYDVEFLTVVTQAGSYHTKPDHENNYVNIADFKGPIGHAIVKFKIGGTIIVSAGHWIELTRQEVSVETLEKVSQNIYGQEYECEMEEIKQEKDYVKQEKKKSELAKKFVTQSVACKLSEKKSKTKK